MKRITLLFIFMSVALSYMTLSAEVITPELAKQTADEWMTRNSEWTGAGDATVNLVEKDGVPAYYVVDYKNGGWTLISAQSSSKPLMGYNLTGNYQTVAPMRDLLDSAATLIVERARTAGDASHIEWEGKPMQRAAQELDYPDIEPLITFNIGQNEPFNNQCPMLDGERTVVGCVAVAMAQAMMVQRYPYQPKGKYGYSSTNVGYLEVDYDAEKPYDWDAMYSSNETGNYDELCRFLFHCGVAVDMEYGLSVHGGSGAQSRPIVPALSTYFGYDPQLLGYRFKDDYKSEGWLDVVVHEIYLGRVVIFMGAGDGGGHCWNIDGWSNLSQFVHVNWGWDGIGNGYFDLENMRDDFQGLVFPDNNHIIVGVGSPSTAPYGIELSCTEFAIGTPAGVALADVKVYCEDTEGQYEYELYGPVDIWGDNSIAPYEIVDGKLYATQTVEDTGDFRYLKIIVTNTNTGESYTKVFNITISAEGSVEAVLSDVMAVYPSVAENNITIDVPVVGGEYAIYSVSGAQVAHGVMNSYKNTIDVASYPAGTYILRYVHNEGVGVKTFVKK